MSIIVIICVVISLFLSVLKRKKRIYNNTSFFEDFWIHYMILIIIYGLISGCYCLYFLFIDEYRITTKASSDQNDCLYKFTKEQLIQVKDECEYANQILSKSIIYRIFARFEDIVYQYDYYSLEYIFTLFGCLMILIMLFENFYMKILNWVYTQRSNHAENYTKPPNVNTRLIKTRH